MNIDRLVYLDDIKKERVKLLCKWWGSRDMMTPSTFDQFCSSFAETDLFTFSAIQATHWGAMCMSHYFEPSTASYFINHLQYKEYK